MEGIEIERSGAYRIELEEEFGNEVIDYIVIQRCLDNPINLSG